MISVALMCHPRRAGFVEELQRQLPEADVVWDRHDDRWETGTRSLVAADPAADFHLVVQDDAVLCRDLVAGAELAALSAGERPVSLYCGKVRPHAETITPAVKRARRMGSPWISTVGPYWGVGLVLPTAHIPEIVRWGDNHREIKNYDRRIDGFYREQGIDCWYTIPSLVNHRPVAENPSLVEGRTGNRTAHWFIGEDSPLDIDWSIDPIQVRR